MSFELDKSFERPVYSPVCITCKHLHEKPWETCDAFLEQIPDEIWVGENDHTKPFPGDNGIMYEKYESS